MAGREDDVGVRLGKDLGAYADADLPSGKLNMSMPPDVMTQETFYPRNFSCDF